MNDDISRIEQEKDELRSILNAVGDGILVVSPDGRIDLYNDAAVSVLGQVLYDFYYKTGKLNIMGKKLSDLVTLYDSADNPVDPIQNVVSQGLPEARQDIYFKTTETGPKTILYTNTAPVFDEREKIKKVVMLFRDITAEKELQERMEEFISVTSHELRTPVAVIEGNLSTALLPNIGEMDAKIRKFITNAYENTTFLSKLIENLTTLRKMEAHGITKEELESFDLVNLLRELVDEFKGIANKRGLELKLVLPKEFVPEIKTSRAELKQVLVNLIGNGIKYTDKGDVTVALEYDMTSFKFEILVKDSGIGIKPEHQKKIFTRFYRAEDWRTRKTGGTGLGLYISRRVAQHLGGEITFESSYGKGSTFILSVPEESPIAKKTIE